MSALQEEVSSYRQIAIDSAAEIMKCLTETPTNAGVSALPDASHALFEVWCTRTGHDYCFDRNANGDYVWADCFGAFDAWQDSRKQALEEAAKACHDAEAPGWTGYECQNTFNDGKCAAEAAIKELLK